MVFAVTSAVACGHCLLRPPCWEAGTRGGCLCSRSGPAGGGGGGRPRRHCRQILCKLKSPVTFSILRMPGVIPACEVCTRLPVSQCPRSAALSGKYKPPGQTDHERKGKLCPCSLNKRPHIFTLHWALPLLDQVGKLRHMSGS